MGLLGSLFGCGDKKSNKTDNLIEITSKTEDGFQDLVLTVVESNQLDDGTFEIFAKGKNNNENVGLRIKVKNKLKPGFNGGEVDNTAFESNGVTFYSIGQESDNLIRGLSLLYNFPTEKKFSVNHVTFDIFSLNEVQADLEKGYFRFKLFFDPNDDFGLYSELYLNVNLPDSEVEIHEKDVEYRENLINAMTRD